MTTRLGSLNTFCWMDLKTRDLPGTATFFAKALGWDFVVDEADWRRATKVTVDGHALGGVSDLADPVYPPGTPARVAYYLAVDDVDRRTEAALDHGATMVLPPFDAGDQGRMATLVDPVGAAFSLWQPYAFAGWHLPPHLRAAPQGMVLVCDRPEEARRFYRAVTGTALACADFVAPGPPGASAPQWELVVRVVDLDRGISLAGELGHDRVTWYEGVAHRIVRISSPEGLTFQIRGPGQ